MRGTFGSVGSVRPRRHRMTRIGTALIAGGSVIGLLGVASVSTVLAWSSPPTLTALCAPNSSEYAWQVSSSLTGESDYNELIQLEALGADGAVRSAAGTLIGKASSPRIVSINGREVEVVATGKLLIIENRDEPGMIGYVGTLLGKDKVNIANMSLSRQEAGQTALMVINLDSEPSEAARRELKGHKAIKLAKFIQL